MIKLYSDFECDSRQSENIDFKWSIICCGNLDYWSERDPWKLRTVLIALLHYHFMYYCNIGCFKLWHGLTTITEMVQTKFKHFILGESTTVGRILNKNDFGDKLKDYVAGKLTKKSPAVWGTCSGLIMLANKLENQKIGGQYHVKHLIQLSI